MYYRKYTTAASVSQAIHLMKNDVDVCLIAGGTDIMVKLRNDHRMPPVLVDISRIPELNEITVDENSITIGAAVTHTRLINSVEIQQEAPLLVDACRQIGATQIQHMGTIGGNIANASPAGDTLPPLYVLDALVHIIGLEGERQEHISQFITGVHKTSLKTAEIITAISFKKPNHDTGSAFLKFGLRDAQAISIASVAVLLEIREEVIHSACIALGAVSPTIVRSHPAETFLVGQKPAARIFIEAGEIAQADSDPIDDIRGGATFRRYLIKPLIQRCLETACQRANK